MSRVSHVPHMNESCPTHEWVMSHTWISHSQPLRCKTCGWITYASCRRYEWGMSHLWMAFSQTLPCKIYRWVMCDSRHTYGWVISQMWNGFMITFPFKIRRWFMCYIKWLKYKPCRVRYANELYMSHPKRTNDSCHTYEPLLWTLPR